MDFCADKFNAALYGLQYKIVVPRLAVIGYLLCAFFIDRHRRDLLTVEYIDSISYYSCFVKG